MKIYIHVIFTGFVIICCWSCCCMWICFWSSMQAASFPYHFIVEWCVLGCDWLALSLEISPSKWCKRWYWSIHQRKCFLCLKFKLVPLLEFVAFLMQLSALIAIPILLAHTENVYKENSDKHLAIYILIPITLTCISTVWSGWLHKYVIEPRKKENNKDASYRLKSGMYIST